jgi:hypothetical protein
MRPFAIPKWPESLLRFRWWCLLLRSRRLGTHPMTPSMWRLWELVTKFQKLEERHSWLERPTVRICDLLLRPPPPPPSRV